MVRGANFLPWCGAFDWGDKPAIVEELRQTIQLSHEVGAQAKYSSGLHTVGRSEVHAPETPAPLNLQFLSFIFSFVIRQFFERMRDSRLVQDAAALIRRREACTAMVLSETGRHGRGEMHRLPLGRIPVRFD